MIERLSERVGPTGSLQGEGLANVLGRPPFDPLTLALRESGQNIWDARLRGSSGDRSIPTMLVRVRTLTDNQDRSLRSILVAGDRREEESAQSDLLQRRLAEPAAIRVMEICDFGTCGLAGSPDPQSSKGNFVRFFFDIGTAHFEGGDGGTYGYGRSSLYLAGAARTILVDSLVSGAEGLRRFMACRIGNSYEKRSIQGTVSRFTGRHFWGVRGAEGKVGPLEGPSAMELAETLGMPQRKPGDNGTTILIPWPDLPTSGAGERIAEILLHNLWPKLVSKEGARAMHILVEEDGAPVPVPDPATHAFYTLFADALQTVRTRTADYGAQPLYVTKAQTVTGHIAFSVSQRKHGLSQSFEQEPRPEKVFSQGMFHVALMRPSELVVRYLEFPGIGDGTDWAGVFMCTDDPDVRTAFAISEPPAHDDWVPDRLDGRQATLVGVTKRKRIPEAVNARFGGQVDPVAGLGQSPHSLAGAADQFAQQFLSGFGTAPSVETGGGGGGGGGAGPRLRPVRLANLLTEAGTTVARFSTSLTGTDRQRVRAVVGIEGLGLSEVPADIHYPEIRGWTTPAGEFIPGAECQIVGNGEHFFDVAFMGFYAVNPKCELVD